MSVTGVNRTLYQETGNMRKEPSPGETLVVYALAVVYVLAASRLFRLQEPRWWNLLFPIGLAAIPVAVSAVRRLNLSSVFPVSPAPFRETAGALLLVPLILVFLLPLAQLVAPGFRSRIPRIPPLWKGSFRAGLCMHFFSLSCYPPFARRFFSGGLFSRGCAIASENGRQ